ncbi:MAG: HEAT repeat domain-containing protein [Spirochaetaceae bacterium]|jgi:HEAT repeat protein|nr:HEAT repeat domain-containing protein [Spirochaetaceae bacterium]
MKACAVITLLLMFALPLFPEETGGGETESAAENAAAETDSNTAPADTESATAGNAGTEKNGDAAPANTKNTGQKSVEEQRLETVRYGTENEIASLIQTLKTENAVYLDDELVALVRGTLNRNILTGVFTFFGDRGKIGLEERALKAVTEWDGEANETIIAAIDYLGKVANTDAIEPLKSLLNVEERRFNSSIFQALGRIAGAHEDLRDEIAVFLRDYYTDRVPADDTRREIVSALGETGSSEIIPFLIDIAGNNDERSTIRMAAISALSKIGNPKGLPAILEGVSSQDPNLRSTSVAALGPFSGPEVDHAILEAFRDSYYRTRLGAAQAAGKRKLIEAIPYLAYRAEHDDTPAVKDESIRALGEIGTEETIAIMDSLFSGRRTPDRVKILCAEILLRERPDAFAAKIIAETDDAKKRNQNTLYNGLLKALGAAKTPALENLAKRFLVSGGVTEKSYALDIIVNNRFISLVRDVEALLEDKNQSLSRKAQTSLAALRGRE